MKDLSFYFQPLNPDLASNNPEVLGGQVQMHIHDFPELSKNGVAILAIPEYEGIDHEVDFGNYLDHIRFELYELFPKKYWSKKIYDLGTVLPGKTVEDTYHALSQIVEELVKNDIIPIIIGGTQDLTIAQFDGYKNLEQLVNLVNIDSMPDFGQEMRLNASNYLQYILQRKPNHLFNYSTIGIQHYLVNPNELDLMEKLYFDMYRLGEVNADITKAEPYIRNADLVSMDLLAIRNSDFPQEQFTTPNGFYAEQMCQLARYAGLSDKMSSFGIYNFVAYPGCDSNNKLVAQILWHVLDGINSRFNDYPKSSKSEYTKYRVLLSEFKDEIVFYKSPKSERWWIEIPYHPSKSSKFERHFMVPCSYDDYKTAQENEVPNLWWQTYQKIFV